MQKQLHILLLEDTSSDAELIQRMLRGHASFKADVSWVQSLKTAIESLQVGQYDLIISDLGLSDSCGLETIAKLRNCCQQIPIIAMTSDDADLGLAAIRAGANDFVPKDQISSPVISRAVDHTIERFQMTRELKKANRLLESKNKHLADMYTMSQEFVDNVSHEFRTPLTVIREFAAIVRDGIDGPVTQKQADRLSTLITRTDDLALMVEDLLDTSRIKSGLLKTCRKMNNLGDSISTVETMLKHRAKMKRISLTVRDIPDDLQVFCDDEKLRRILINLIVNAIKFTPVGGKIVISSSIADANRVKITVSDNGHGIAKEDLKRIFNRFQQVGEHERVASCKGFGLGLSIARSLASLNLGSLQVASIEGEGSSFSVLLPAARIDAVLNCFLDQREEFCKARVNEDEIVSVVEVRPDVSIEEDSNHLSEAIDDFIRSTVKNFDLVVRVSPHRWLMYTLSSGSATNYLINRFHREWSKLKRNNYGETLPGLHFNHLGAVNLHCGRQQLIELAGLTESTAEEVPRKPSGKVHFDQKRILVIEDEQEVANALHARLAASGFAVQTVNNGPAGIEAAQRLKPDAILLDLRMPEMDGIEVLDQLQLLDDTKRTPVVMLSASHHDQQRALDHGAKFFLKKPFDSQAIEAAIGSAMKESSLLKAGSNHAK